jgi:hypothetical protein
LPTAGGESVVVTVISNKVHGGLDELSERDTPEVKPPEESEPES